MLSNINFYKNFLKVHNNAGGYEWNRSIKHRLNSAFRSQERRAGQLTKQDDLTVEELVHLVYNTPYCKVCGFEFNTFTRKNDEGYTWQIAHIKSPELEGHLTLDNLQIIHTACNHAQGQQVMDFAKLTERLGVGAYLDIIHWGLENGTITGKEPEHRLFAKLLQRINDGFNPNRESGR